MIFAHAVHSNLSTSDLSHTPSIYLENTGKDGKNAIAPPDHSSGTPSPDKHENTQDGSDASVAAEASGPLSPNEGTVRSIVSLSVVEDEGYNNVSTNSAAGTTTPILQTASMASYDPPLAVPRSRTESPSYSYTATTPSVSSLMVDRNPTPSSQLSVGTSRESSRSRDWKEYEVQCRGSIGMSVRSFIGGHLSEIASVTPGGAAYQAGIPHGAVILAIEGLPMAGASYRTIVQELCARQSNLHITLSTSTKLMRRSIHVGGRAGKMIILAKERTSTGMPVVSGLTTEDSHRGRGLKSRSLERLSSAFPRPPSVSKPKVLKEKVFPWDEIVLVDGLDSVAISHKELRRRMTSSQGVNLVLQPGLRVCNDAARRASEENHQRHGPMRLFNGRRAGDGRIIRTGRSSALARSNNSSTAASVAHPHLSEGDDSLSLDPSNTSMNIANVSESQSNDVLGVIAAESGSAGAQEDQGLPIKATRLDSKLLTSVSSLTITGAHSQASS